MKPIYLLVRGDKITALAEAEARECRARYVGYKRGLVLLEGDMLDYEAIVDWWKAGAGLVRTE